jgi:adenine-specific DNA-methyltransferase
VIKYLGSKRRLVPVLGQIATAVEAESAVDLFTGTTRVAQEFKRRGIHVTTVDTASYAHVLARCFIAADADDIDAAAMQEAIDELTRLPGRRGYFTRVFCEEARYLQPKNGMRVDAIRDAIEEQYAEDPAYPLLLTSLLLAADRVDSTTGLQMAYLKQWAPRSSKDLELRMPEFIRGAGTALLGDAAVVSPTLPRVDLAYLDPPYNQHSYRGNYHVWETLVRWDDPEHYGVARKRMDVRSPETKSLFNSRRTMPAALAGVIAAVDAETVVVSYNDESWVTADEMTAMLHDAGHERVELLEFDARRYVGAQIGIHNPAGERVGEVRRLRNVEYVFVAGERERVEAAVTAARTPIS